MDVKDIGEVLFELVKWVSAVGVLFKALDNWAVKPLIKQMSQSFNQAIDRQNEPIKKLILKLEEQNYRSEQARIEIKQLSLKNEKILDKHEELLDSHDDRLIVLETTMFGGHQQVTYKEKYKGEN